MFPVFSSCEQEVIAAIYTKGNGIIRSIDIYKVAEKGIMTGLKTKNTLEVETSYNFYFVNHKKVASYPDKASKYHVNTIAYSKEVNAFGEYIYMDFTQYWGVEEMVSFKAKCKYYKTLKIKLTEKKNTYKIVYYDIRDGETWNDIFEGQLDDRKKVIELNKSEIKKIEYAS